MRSHQLSGRGEREVGVVVFLRFCVELWDGAAD